MEKAIQKDSKAEKVTTTVAKQKVAKETVEKEIQKDSKAKAMAKPTVDKVEKAKALALRVAQKDIGLVIVLRETLERLLKVKARGHGIPRGV